MLWWLMVLTILAMIIFCVFQLSPMISQGLPAEAANFLQQYLTAAGVQLA